jgi:hypothetical protein
MPDEKLIKRRLPSIEKSISEIHPDSDVRIRLIGTIIDVGPSSIVLDDGSGKIEVYFEEVPKVRQGQLVRVVTRILPLIDGYECKGEILQNLDGFNLKLYKKARDLTG